MPDSATIPKPRRVDSRLKCPPWCVETHDTVGWAHTAEPVLTSIGSVTLFRDGARHYLMIDVPAALPHEQINIKDTEALIARLQSLVDLAKAAK